MLIRRETPADEAAVRDVTVAAFTGVRGHDPAAGEPVEAGLLDQLRSCEGWLPALSLVAEDTVGELVGHVVCTRGRIGTSDALGLGPLSVSPAHQRRGVGKALVHSVLGAADALGEPLVVLLGDPAYYGRFGFRPSGAYGIVPPDPQWGDFFQARPLSSHRRSLTGTFAYAEPFTRL